MSGVISGAFRTAYELAFQVSPIILQGGITSALTGNMLPIIGLTGQLASFAQGVASNGGIGANDFFAQYLPIPGGTLINNSVGMYPFANQQVAANAVIEQPLNISLLMIAPVKDAGGYVTKTAIFTALQASLRKHNNSGGTYAIATPAFVYTNCIMTGMTDVTSGEGKQQQIEWQLDFIKPLITASQATTAFGSLAHAIDSGQQVVGQPGYSGAAAGTGAPLPGATSLIAGASYLSGAVNNFLATPAL